MANRYFHKMQANVREAKDIFAEAAIGASGAPTLTANSSPFVTTWVRNGAGDYTITLSDAYNAIISFSADLIDTTARDFTYQVHTRTAGTASIRFLCITTATATDPPNGGTLMVRITCKNSSLAL